jgi:PAS domain S-box-containing protein
MILSSIRECAYVLDGESRFLYANDSLLKIWALPLNEVVGKNFYDLKYPDDLARRLERQVRHVVASGEGVIDETGFVDAAGNYGHYEYIFAPVFSPQGAVEAVAGSARDITARRQEAERLRDSSERLLAAERSMLMKDQFMAMVAHELRTPLSAILLWARLLRGGTVEPGQQAKAMEAIEQSAVAQKRMIEDLMDMSRMLSGKLRMNMSRADLVPVLERAVQALRSTAAVKSVPISLSAGVQSAFVRADPERFQQVVWNIVNNAIKFSRSEGIVNVGYQIVGDSFQFRVDDTGIGISADLLPHVFERFRQDDAAARDRQSGLGLGLAITRELVELHGGTIRAASDGKGCGASFTVELPLAEGRTDEEVGASAPAALPPV